MKVLANFIGNMAKINAKFTILTDEFFGLNLFNNNYFKLLFENMYADCLKTENS